ncbi:MAG: HpaII family restriction endonuclease, partial [Mucinivorans sp.]
QIVSELLLLYFSGTGSRLNMLSDILQVSNPIGYNTAHKHKFYEYKIKRLLSDAALGMKPATMWTGIFEANGGYLVVKEDGDVLCYHIYNRNEFENYLLNTSFIDTPSSTKHGFGSVEVIDGKQMFKLNLQIRFI